MLKTSLLAYDRRESRPRDRSSHRPADSVGSTQWPVAIESGSVTLRSAPVGSTSGAVRLGAESIGACSPVGEARSVIAFSQFCFFPTHRGAPRTHLAPRFTHVPRRSKRLGDARSQKSPHPCRVAVARRCLFVVLWSFPYKILDVGVTDRPGSAVLRQISFISLPVYRTRSLKPCMPAWPNGSDSLSRLRAPLLI